MFFSHPMHKKKLFLYHHNFFTLVRELTTNAVIYVKINALLSISGTIVETNLSTLAFKKFNACIIKSQIIHLKCHQH